MIQLFILKLLALKRVAVFTKHQVDRPTYHTSCTATWNMLGNLYSCKRIFSTEASNPNPSNTGLPTQIYKQQATCSKQECSSSAEINHDANLTFWINPLPETCQISIMICLCTAVACIFSTVQRSYNVFIFLSDLSNQSVWFWVNM